MGQRVEAVAKKIGSKHDHQVNFSNELTEQPDHMRKAVLQKTHQQFRVVKLIPGFHSNHAGYPKCFKLHMSVFGVFFSGL